MAISNNHKLALLYMMRELLENTDEKHTMNAADLIKALKKYDCEADRRTIYSNAAILEDFGLDIIKKEDEHVGYYIGSREFELPELKLLVDAVQSSKFITEKKSEQLIKKLMRQTNEQKAQELKRSVHICDRVKTLNEKIFYTLDALHKAINENRQIEFQYGEYNINKRIVAKKNGAFYKVSPWVLTWDDENYYLIAFDENADKIKHFRVDKIMKIDLLEEERNGQNEFKDVNLAAFARKTFGMFGGRDERITLRCENAFAGVIIDRFGKEVVMIPDGENHFKANVTIAVSPQFFGWMTGIGRGLEIISPKNVREEYQNYLKDILKDYKK